MKKRTSDNLSQTGIITAHEMGHILTLKGHSGDPTNLMAPVEPPGGNTTLTDTDAEEFIKNGLPSHGTKKVKSGSSSSSSPMFAMKGSGAMFTMASQAEEAQQQFGSASDDTDDIASGVAEHFDLSRIVMSSEVVFDDIKTLLTLNGMFPDSGPVDAAYRLLFDADANAGTGLDIAGFSGIDKEVRINVSGDASIAPLTVSGIVVDHLAGSTETPLPSTPQLDREELLDVTPAIDVEDQLAFDIPKALLNLTADDVPIGVVAEDENDVIQDDMSLVFDLDFFENLPKLILPQEQARPGELVAFGVNGLTPDSTFDLTVGDETVFSGTLDASGGFAGNFTFPDLSPDHYFVIVQDSEGEFASNVIEALPIPSDIKNGNFEMGTLDGWDIAPGSVASAITSLGPTGPFTPITAAEGQFMAFLSTAGTALTPPGTRGSVISQTFIMPAEVSTLDFCYQYVSNDASGFENFFLAELVTDVGTFALASADNAAGSPAGGFVAPPPPSISAGVTLIPDPSPIFLSGVNILGSGLFTIPSSLMTERVRSSFDIPPAVLGTVVTLRFTMGDALDTAFDSAVLIDGVTFAASPIDSDSDGILNAEDNCLDTFNPDQADSNFDGIGDACQQTTALGTTAFLQANLDGSSLAEVTDIAVGEPPLEEQITRIIDFQINEIGLPFNEINQLLNSLVDSQVDLGLVQPGEEDELVEAVLEAVVLPALSHPFVLLADKQIHISADSLMMGQSSSDGDIHANDKIHFHKGNMSTHTGNLTAVKDIKVDKDNTINGDATAGRKVDLKGSAVVNGTVTENALVSTELLPALSFTTGGADVTVPKGGSQSLAPGSYGKVKVAKNATLSLSSGDYFMVDLDLKDDTILDVDVSAGPVTINTDKKLHFHKNSQVTINSPVGHESRFVTFNSMKKVDVHDGARVLGTLNAPDDKVRLKRNVLFQGSICAKDIHIDKGSTVLHHNSSIPLPLAKVSSSADDGEEVETAQDFTTTSIPAEFALEQNYPNPFNPTTEIRFQLPAASHVLVRIFNTLGQEIRTLTDIHYEAGFHSVRWDAKDNKGSLVSSGIYLNQLQTGSFSEIRKMTLLR
ncbi:MAG: FlgD immunoglobulin-like domain containing protein [Nitrospirales bacterium]